MNPLRWQPLLMLSFMRMALHGRLDPAWLMAWGLLLVTVIPLRLGSTWSQGRLAFGVGGLLKTRLLAGTLRLAPEEMRHQGAGQFLGRVLEADAVEGLALSGGRLALLAGVEVVMAACVLGWEPGAGSMWGCWGAGAGRRLCHGRLGSDRRGGDATGL